MHSNSVLGMNRRQFGGSVGLGLLTALLGGPSKAEGTEPDRLGKKGRPLTRTEEDFLLGLQKQHLRYFLDNQVKNGFIRDRQRNHTAPRVNGLTSSSATGMGLIAIALARAQEYNLISATESDERIIRALKQALAVPEVNGMIAHFYTEDGKPIETYDAIATIDSSWLIAGGLWAAAFSKSPTIHALANKLYERVNWRLWTDGSDRDKPDLLRHGMANTGKPLLSRWDRLNAETAFMYLIATAACGTKNIDRAVWKQLAPYWSKNQGCRSASGDLGLFAQRWSLELFDFAPYVFTDGLNLVDEGALGAWLNYQTCRSLASIHKTFKILWGLSAGDGPADDHRNDDPPGAMQEEKYREYGPGYTDGTANIESTGPAIGNCTDEVLDNMQASIRIGRILGRYGFSSVNLDRKFISPDVIATDLAATVLAFDNVLFGGRIRRVFAEVPCIAAARESLREYRRAS